MFTEMYILDLRVSKIVYSSRLDSVATLAEKLTHMICRIFPLYPKVVHNAVAAVPLVPDDNDIILYMLWISCAERGRSIVHVVDTSNSRETPHSRCVSCT